MVYQRIAIALVASLMAVQAPAWAQDESVPENRFLLSGFGFATFDDADNAEENFNAAFVPIFLYRISDKFLFEAEVELEFEGDELETTLEYAQLDWLVNDRLTVVMGKYLTPFGTFIEKIHPAWINKLPTFPLPYQHDRSLVPFSQTGLQLRGGIPFGDGYRRFSYSIFVANGFQIAEQHGEEGEGGELAVEVGHSEDGEAEEGDEHGEEEELLFFDGATSNTGDLAIGGRIAIAPARGFEIGISSLEGSYDEAAQLDASMTSLDFAYHHDVFDVRGEWLDTEANRLAGDGDPLPDQEIESWYLQASLRLSVIPVYALNKVELVGRFANLDWGAGDIEQTSVGANYYFNGSTVLRLAWERTDETGEAAEDALMSMFAVGF